MPGLIAIWAVSAALVGTPPAVTVAHIQTYYDTHAANRSDNIERAARMLGTFTLPVGETFSFNKIVGKKGDEGFLPDRVFVNHKVAIGLGGGICQLASTLYATALRAGMTIVERHAHGLPVTYLPLGEDATVAWDLLDLRFRNDGPGPVEVKVEAQAGNIDVTFTGQPRPYQIEVRHDLMKKIPFSTESVEAPPPLPLTLARGLDGARVKTYLLVTWQNGKTERLELSDDTYPPIPRQVVAHPAGTGPS